MLGKDNKLLSLRPIWQWEIVYPMREAGAYPYLANRGEKGGNGELKLPPRNHIYNVKQMCKVEQGAKAVSKVPAGGCGAVACSPTFQPLHCQGCAMHRQSLQITSSKPDPGGKRLSVFNTC